MQYDTLVSKLNEQLTGPEGQLFDINPGVSWIKPGHVHTHVTPGLAAGGKTSALELQRQVSS